MDRQTESLELDLLLAGISKRYGYDFSGYTRAALAGRVRQVMFEEGLPTVSALQERVLHDPPAMERFVERVTAQPISMFQNPDRYLALRREVVPLLRTYPFVRVWHSGCGTGEEVYSTAILLHEEGLHERARIYATDVSEAHIERARRATFPLAGMQDDADAARRAGCRQDLSAYYEVHDADAVIVPALRRNVIFSRHNLVCDEVFNEFQLIVCRNVLSVYDPSLRNRALEVLHRSLCTFGVLALGARESVRGTRLESDYEPLPVGLGLFRRIR